MRRQIDSKSGTCTEGVAVDAAGISGKVGAHYPGISVGSARDRDRVQNITPQHRKTGFSIYASVNIPAGSSKIRKALSQYIACPPLSLKKISIEDIGAAAVISYTSGQICFSKLKKLV